MTSGLVAGRAKHRDTGDLRQRSGYRSYPDDPERIARPDVYKWHSIYVSHLWLLLRQAACPSWGVDVWMCSGFIPDHTARSGGSLIIVQARK